MTVTADPSGSRDHGAGSSTLGQFPRVRRFFVELPRASGYGAVVGAGGGALALGADALANAPRALPLALILGAACGAVVGLALGVARHFTSRLPAWLGWAGWILGGVGLGFVSATGVGALDHLRGSRHVLATVTLAVGCLGGGSLGAALAFAQSARAIESTTPAMTRLRWFAAFAAAVGCLLVTAAPAILRWLVVYPLAMRVSIALAFMLAYCAVACAAARLLRRADTWSRGVVAGAGAILLALSLAPGSLFGSILATYQGSTVVRTLRAVSDLDRDGASSLFGGGDCAATDPGVHPRAREIPGNGVDDNCMFGDAPRPAHSTEEFAATPAAEPSPVSVVLITIDALRADHTQPYGYAKPTTPNLARFARGARRYERAYTAGGRTGLGLVSLLGGFNAREQQWKLVPRVLHDRTPDRSPWDVVPVEWRRRPLPYWLERRGMQTAAVLHFGAASWFTAGNTFSTQFQRFVVEPQRDELPDSHTVDAALEVVAGFGAAPFFLWVHLYGPHDPHPKPGADEPNFGSGIVASYDSDIWRTDRELGRLLDALDRVGGPPRVTVITADHSEELAGDRTFHAVDLFRETPRIPLFVRGPGIEAGVDTRVVSAIDIAPSVMAWTRTPAPPYAGIALSARPRPRVAFCDVFRPIRGGGLSLEQLLATDGEHRFVVDWETGREEFALAAHPDVRLSDVTPSMQALRESALRYVEQHGPPRVAVNNPDQSRIAR